MGSFSSLSLLTFANYLVVLCWQVPTTKVLLNPRKTFTRSLRFPHSFLTRALTVADAVAFKVVDQFMLIFFLQFYHQPLITDGTTHVVGAPASETSGRFWKSLLAFALHPAMCVIFSLLFFSADIFRAL